MRLTYTDIQNQFLRNINYAGNTADTNLIANFNYYLGTRYQMMLAKLRNYKTTTSTTFATIANTQYYPFPLGTISILGMFITIGSVNYPLQIISTIFGWEELNAILIQASALPQFYFPRRDDFGIWPIPQAVYTGTISYHYRDHNLSIADSSGGTITLTNGSATLTGTASVFTAGMVGQWVTVTDTTVPGWGYWIRITGYTNANTLTLFQNWPNATVSTTGYKIGQTPEIPEELHMLLAAGVTADYYTYIQKDLASAAPYENIFWTGDPANPSRQEGSGKIGAGLIGGVDRYNDRDDSRVIKRKPRLNPLQYKVWATSLS